MTETQRVTFLGTAALKGTVMLAVAGLVNASWRTASASARHLVWTLGIASALTLPLLSAAIEKLGAPRIEIGSWTQSVESPPLPNAASAQSPVASQNSSAKLAASFSFNSAIAEAGAVQLHTETPTTQQNLPTEEQRAAQSRSSLQSSSGWSRDEARVLTADVSRNWPRDGLYLWIAGLVLSLAPLITATARVQVIGRRATRLTKSRWTSLIETTPAIAHLARRVRIMESETTTMPMTWGILSPTLLVPSSSECWPEWQCRNILLHELAHVERLDCLTQLVAQLACAVYWFNPLVWIAAHRMRVERELACDDRVISTGSRASDYATNLLDVARSLRAPSYTSQSAIAMARPSQLSGRLLAVLDAKRNRRSVTRRVATGVSLSAIALGLPLAFMTPGAQAATLAEAPSPAPELVAAFSSDVPAAMVVQDAFPIQAAAVVKAAQLPTIGLVARAMSNIPLRGPTAAATVPAFVVQDGSCWADSEGNSHSSSNTSISNDDSPNRRPSWSVRYSRDDCSMELRAEGRFTLRPDLSDLESIDSDGWFRIEERIGRSTRRVEIKRADNGTLDHQYWVNGDRVAFNDDARAWLARTLLAVERRTAFAATTRVPQLYRSSGLKGVLSEIALMPAAYAKSRYYGALLDMDIKLDANTLNNVVRQVSTDLSSSDYYMSEVLSKFAAQPAANEATWRTFAEAAGRMKSDYYKSQTLKKVLNKGQLSNETVGILLKSASGMSSDYYLSELLKSVAGKYALNAQTRPYYVEVLGKIESDYYRGELLKSMGTEGDWDPKTSAFVLTSVSDIKSDYYRSEALIRLVKSRHVDNWPGFYSAAGGISSDYYKRETVLAVLRQPPLTKEIVAGALGLAAKMKSDNDITEILTSVARSYKIDDSLRPAFEKAVDAIESDYYRGSVLSALRRNTAQ